MNNTAPFHKSDVGRTLNRPMVDRCMQKVPTHVFTIHTSALGEYIHYLGRCLNANVCWNFATAGVKGLKLSLGFVELLAYTVESSIWHSSNKKGRSYWLEIDILFQLLPGKTTSWLYNKHLVRLAKRHLSICATLN